MTDQVTGTHSPTPATEPLALRLSEGLGRCGKCKHWRRYSMEFDVNYHGKHAGTCNSDKFVYDEGPQPPQDGLRYWDYEGYSAGFDTGEDFGCVHWVAA